MKQMSEPFSISQLGSGPHSLDPSRTRIALLISPFYGGRDHKCSSSSDVQIERWATMFHIFSYHHVDHFQLFGNTKLSVAKSSLTWTELRNQWLFKCTHNTAQDQVKHQDLASHKIELVRKRRR